VKPKRQSLLVKAMENFDSGENDIVLITINAGYVFLFINWVCSVKKLGLDPTAFTLVIIVEPKSESLVRRMGFNYVSVYDWLGKAKRISSAAPEAFALGDYKWIAAILNLYMIDLIDLGFNVLMQDVDVTWNRNPMQYFNKNPSFDILVVEDSKWSEHHKRYSDKARNGGFVFYRANCRTQVYTGTLKNSIVHILWMRSDQTIMNRLLDNYRFQGIRVGFLPKDLFLNGHRWSDWGTRRSDPLPWNPYIYHTSWTAGISDKVFKLMSIEQWFNNCEFFDAGLVPSINITEKLRKYVTYFGDEDTYDWLHVAEKLLGNILKPYRNMDFIEDSTPVLDKWAGRWHPKEKRL